MWRLCSCLLLQKQEGAMVKQYIVNVADDERAPLLALTKCGKVSARRLSRAYMLLEADTGLLDDAIAQAFQIGTATVQRIRRRFVEESLEGALSEQRRPEGQCKLDGKQAAFLMALVWSTPPEGAHWTMPWLADRLVELQVVGPISDEMVRRTLKKSPQAVAERGLVTSECTSGV